MIVLTARKDEEARPSASKVLSKWRPEVIAAQQQPPPGAMASDTNGVQQQVTTNA
jgi:symplekin